VTAAISARTPNADDDATALARLRELTVDRCRETIARENEQIRAVLHVLDEPAFDPGAVDKGPLAGIPYVLKDVWDTKGIVTTGGSYRHRARVPSADAHAFAALKKTGAVMLGKSNLCDLAFSAESDNHIFGPVRNPHDHQRTAGGSTGGGAAAVAAKMAAFDWGSDFGGSIRSPAAFCGIVGLRLSNATWPLEAEHFPRTSPFFWSFCGMGPLTRTVAEAAFLTRVLEHDLRKKSAPHVSMSDTDVVLYSPDRFHHGDWPSFDADALAFFSGMDVRVHREAPLPGPTKVNRLFAGYLCSHFDEFAKSGDEIALRDGVVAVLAGLASGGRLDKRVHPNTGALLLLVALGRISIFRDRAKWESRYAAFNAQVNAIWRSGRFIVSPTTTLKPPKHGRAAFAHGVQSFTKFGNLTDSTSIAVPFGRFPGTSLSRSLQILGPPGSERALCAFAEKVESRAARVLP